MATAATSNRVSGQPYGRLRRSKARCDFCRPRLCGGQHAFRPRKRRAISHSLWRSCIRQRTPHEGLTTARSICQPEESVFVNQRGRRSGKADILRQQISITADRPTTMFPRVVGAKSDRPPFQANTRPSAQPRSGSDDRQNQQLFEAVGPPRPTLYFGPTAWHRSPRYPPVFTGPRGRHPETCLRIGASPDRSDGQGRLSLS